MKREPVVVRRATAADAAAIARISNEGIADNATFETDERTAQDRLAWLTERSDRHPVFVAVRENEVRGWASLNPFNLRYGYRHVVDLSVYVDRAWRGAGIGTALMWTLVDAATGLGYHKIVLSGFPWNEAGMRLYRQCGFRDVGIYREQGQLDGKWVDTIIMELLLPGVEAGEEGHG